MGYSTRTRRAPKHVWDARAEQVVKDAVRDTLNEIEEAAEASDVKVCTQEEDDILRPRQLPGEWRKFENTPSIAVLIIGSKSAEEKSTEVEIRYDWLYAKGCSRGPNAGPLVGHATDWDSMQAALEILGCKPTYHGYTPLYKIDECAKWIRAFDAKYHKRGPLFTLDDWDELLGNYCGVTDSPAICFAEELIETYPEAKVVLVERDIEKWYQSFSVLIEEMYNPIVHVLRILDPQVLGPTATMYNYVYRDRSGFCRTDNKKELHDTAKTLYREHYEHVKRLCPKDRLLNFRLEDGWGPLCEFLGKEEPDVPFPRLNEGAALAEKFKEFEKRSLLLVLRNLILVGILLWAGLLVISWARG